MAKLQCLQADYAFRGGEHAVRMAVNGGALEVEVEDRLTTDQWRGEFDAAFIEDLTHKTGNFKQFGIFCSMLESALTQSSESVSLDLLTYTDLEALRSRKVGVGPRHLPSALKASPLSSKRYLILIYSVEFDRIHYPLPLPYVGKPDPVALQKVIRELKEELALLKARPGKDFRDAEIRRLQDELQRTLEEKQEVESVVLGLQEEMRLATKSCAAKEVKILKKIVQSLEEELLKEKTKHQRAATKRLQENRQLASELAEVKASERTLRIRVKSLTAELALYKKGVRVQGSEPAGRLEAERAALPRSTPTGSAPQSRSAAARASGHGKAREEPRSSSGERAAAWPPPRQRSASRESRGGSQSRLPRQSPSPAGSRPPRFDPTAFVKAKERKQKEAELRNPRRPRRGAGAVPWARGVSAGGGGGDSPGRSRGRSSSAESVRSRRSAVSSGSEADEYSEPVPLRRRAARTRKPLSSSSWNGPSSAPRAAGHKKHSASTPSSGRRAGKENLYEEPAADLSEIDARLQALQEYMNNLDTRT
ncbi:centrosomal protein CCDC61 isoform X2 [Rhea pennata]|uniref:centrosomal protein CCDC61 isoform X2 n=1 Tax=Rhea pennata TaxID=8795 RepID=UPI002E259E29